MTETSEADRLVLAMFRSAGRADPYPALHALRRLGPVVRSDVLGGWAVTGAAACREALAGEAFAVPDAAWMDVAVPHWRDVPALRFLYTSLLRCNPPAHTRLRRLLAPATTPHAVGLLTDIVSRRVGYLLDDLRARLAHGPADLQAVVAFPLATAAVGDLLPRTGGPVFTRRDAEDVVALFELRHDDEQLRRAGAALDRVARRLEPLLAAGDSRDAGAPELLAGLLSPDGIGPAEGGDRAERAELLLLLHVAGVETLAGLVGNAVDALLRQPGRLAELDDSMRLRGAVEEMLRWDPPVQLTERVATRATELAGVHLPAGAFVVPFLGAAGRDPARCPDPDVLDVTREGPRPMAFGAGGHHCPGAALARLNVRLLLGALADRFPRLSPAGPARRRATLTTRSPVSLPVRLAA